MQPIMKARIHDRVRRALPVVPSMTVVLAVMVAPVSVAHARPDASSGTRQQVAPYVETLPKSVVKIEMIPVAKGTVKIGDKSIEVKPFYIAKTETTWEAFDVFIASGPASKACDQTGFAPDAIARPSKSYILPDLGWGHNGYPAINLSATTVEMFCRWLSAETKKKYRLPTEAEWELACRAGQGDAWTLSADDLPKSAWYLANSKRMTHPVGKTEPNKLGLLDMLGNTGEWAIGMDGKPLVCGGTFLDPADKQAPGTRRRYDPSWQETDPQIPKSRWWLSDAPFAGFRLVCEP